MSAIRNNPHKHRQWLAWLVGAVVTGAVIFGWNAMNQREQADMKRSTAMVLDWLETAITRDLDQRMSSLRRIADRWSHNGGTARSAWEADVAHYIADQPGYQAIERVDGSLNERWIMTPAGSVDSQSVPMAGPLLDEISDRLAEDRRLPGLSDAMTLDQGRQGFMAFQPIGEGQQFDGFIIAIFEFESWLNTLMNVSNDELFGVRILLGDQLVFDTSTSDNPADDNLLQQSTVSLHGRQWTIAVWLSGTRMAANQSRVADALLWAGLLVSVLLGWALHATLKSRAESAELQVHTQQLEAQWKNLPGMAYRSLAGQASSIEFVSDGCLALTGHTKSSFEQGLIRWDELVHPDDRAMHREQLERATTRGQPFRAEYRIICSNGTEKWVWERGNISHSPFDQTSLIEGLVLDVTDQKLTEIALTDATAYAQTVVDTAAEAIITISTRGEIESINRSVEQIFGYCKEELVGQNLRLLMPEPYMSEHDAYIEHYLQTGEKRIIGVGREVFAKRKDGVVFPIQLSVSEFVTKDERKFVGLIRDLTKQQLAEQEASLHRERLAHVGRVNMLGEMATGIAHEINQPLSAISMYAQSGLRFLDADIPKPDRLRDALEKLSVQAHRAGAVIERMQQFARQRESRYETVDCNRLMQEVVNLAESEALIRDAVIRLEIESDIGMVQGDPIQLQQVALNLLRNGMESMASIGHRYGNHIVVRTQDDGDGVKISVVDQGTGVSLEAAEQLYKPFASTKDMGMGIGLSICKSIIHSHGGQLDFVNMEGHGAIFFFTLPYTA